MSIPLSSNKITASVWGPLDEVILTGHDSGDLCQWDIKVGIGLIKEICKNRECYVFAECVPISTEIIIKRPIYNAIKLLIYHSLMIHHDL